MDAELQRAGIQRTEKLLSLRIKAETWMVGGEFQIKLAQRVKSSSITSRDTISSLNSDSSVLLQVLCQSEPHYQTISSTPSQQSSSKATLAEKIKLVETQLAENEQNNNRLSEELQVTNDLNQELYAEMKRALML